MDLAGGSPPWISIIIPCRGHALELRACLEGLGNQEGDIPFEVIVVDSAYDPRVEQVAGEFKSARLIRSSAGLFAGGARNLGAQHATASVLGFVDADCIPGPGWVRAARDVVADGAVVAGGAVLDALPWHWIASTDNRLQFADFPLGRPAGVNVYFPGVQLVVVREVFDSIGGFDESRSSAQDVLFTTAAAREWPGKTIFCPQLVVRHRGRTSWGAFWQHHWEFGYSRAIFNLLMSDTLDLLGKHASLGWLVLLRRWLYMSARVVQWNLRDLPRYMWQSPVMLAGLIAWTQGFYAGKRDAAVGQA